MKIFHQSGHNNNWNRDSFQEHGIGDGIIISPVHTLVNVVEGFDSDLKSHSVFDPQFYVPDSQKVKLNSYHFFPEKLLDGFTTNDFEASAHESAQLCLEFQIRNDFEFLIIPARYHEQMVSNFIEKQKAFSVEPFLSEASKSKTKKKIFLTLPLTAAMLLDSKFRVKVLNWITSYQEIYGIYLLVNFDEPGKQISNFEKLNAYVAFISEVRGADLQVLCGYCNTEGLLLSALDVYGATIGAYENTRRFSIDKFIDDDTEMRGPAPRIYFPKLLNWIRYDTAVEIRDDHPDLWKTVYSPTSFSESIFEKGTRPHFTQPVLYHHHFELINDQYKTLEKIISKEDKINELKKSVSNALALYNDIDNAGILLFDGNCKGEHLPIWNRLLNRMGKPLT